MSVELDIYMRSGAVLTFDVETWKATKLGGISNLTWTNAETGRRLVHVCLDNVDAVVERKNGVRK